MGLSAAFLSVLCTVGLNLPESCWILCEVCFLGKFSCCSAVTHMCCIPIFVREIRCLYGNTGPWLRAFPLQRYICEGDQMPLWKHWAMVISISTAVLWHIYVMYLYLWGRSDAIMEILDHGYKHFHCSAVTHMCYVPIFVREIRCHYGNTGPWLWAFPQIGNSTRWEAHHIIVLKVWMWLWDQWSFWRKHEHRTGPEIFQSF